VRYDADYYLILAGDHLYRMDYCELIDAHIERNADITIAAQPVPVEDASAMGIFRFDPSGRIIAFEEKPKRDRLDEIGQSIPPGAVWGQARGSGMTSSDASKPFVASMGVYVFSREVLLEAIEQEGATDFGRQIIPSALDRYRVNAHLFRGYWADVGTVDSFYDANIMLTRPGAPFKLYDPRRPIFTHSRYLPGARLNDCHACEAIVAEGCYIERSTIQSSIVGIRTTIRSGSTIRRSVLLGADFYEAEDTGPVHRGRPSLGIGRDVVLDRVIVDKNARIGDGAHLVNEAGVDEADGDGYFIRDGIIVVPKDGVIKPGTRV